MQQPEGFVDDGKEHLTFTKSIIKKYGIEDAKPVKTPITIISKLLKATEESELVDKGLYQSAVDSLPFHCMASLSLSTTEKVQVEQYDDELVKCKQIL